MSDKSPELGTGGMWVTPGRTLIHFGGMSTPPPPSKTPLVVPTKGAKA